MPVDRFDADHLLSGVVLTVAAGLVLVLAPSPVAVPVLDRDGLRLRPAGRA